MFRRSLRKIAINDAGEVVGWATDRNGAVLAFLWRNGVMIKMQLAQALNINDRGEIAGAGILPNGDTHPFLLIPCDEHHPGVEGCDYSMVDATAQSLSFKSAARETFVPTPPFAPWRRNNRFRFPALVPTN